MTWRQTRQQLSKSSTCGELLRRFATVKVTNLAGHKLPSGVAFGVPFWSFVSRRQVKLSGSQATRIAGE